MQNLLVATAFALLNLTVFAQCDTEGDLRCCDPDVGVTPGQDAYCSSNWPYVYNMGDANGTNSDIDCAAIDDPGCTSIPLDGGLSLLALAGGGLATAAMRRRREEEEAAQYVA